MCWLTTSTAAIRALADASLRASCATGLERDDEECLLVLPNRSIAQNLSGCNFSVSTCHKVCEISEVVDGSSF